MITRNILLSLRKELKEIDSIIEQSLNPLSHHDKLFNTQADYYEAMKNQNKVPQDFYKFQFFDVEIYLYYDFKNKHYFLKSDYDKIRIDCGDSFEAALIKFTESVKDFCTKRLEVLIHQMDLF